MILIDRGRWQRTISEVWKIYMLKTVCQIYKIRGSEGSKDFIYLANCLKHIYFSCWGYCTRPPASIFYISRFIELCTPSCVGFLSAAPLMCHKSETIYIYKVAALKIGNYLYLFSFCSLINTFICKKKSRDLKNNSVIVFLATICQE